MQETPALPLHTGDWDVGVWGEGCGGSEVKQACPAIESKASEAHLNQPNAYDLPLPLSSTQDPPGK